MKKLTITLAGFAAAFLILAFVSANYSVSRTEKAINEIGKVTYSQDSQEKIDKAITYLDALDPDLHLEDRIPNTGELDSAKKEYVRLAIKTAAVMDQRKEADGYTDEEIAQAVAEARAAAEQYCDTGDCTEIENFSDLAALEEKYTGGDTADAGSSAQEGQEEKAIELC